MNYDDLNKIRKYMKWTLILLVFILCMDIILVIRWFVK